MTDNEQAALEKLLAMEASTLELSVATNNLLNNRGICTIRDILKIPEAELTNIAGRRGSLYIEDRLRELGLFRDALPHTMNTQPDLF